MATWMVHFRIAENLLKMGLKASEKEFLVGNIGPDCGLPNDQVEGGFYPPKEVTHFKEDYKISPNLFFEKYLNKDCIHITDPKFSFYVGYYLHLITDVEWSIVHNEKKKEPNYQAVIGTSEYTRIIKGDWYGGDFLYLSENKDNIFNNVFQHIKNFPDYLDIFPENQISKQINRITEFYLGNSYAFALNPTYRFKYLTPDEVTQFVNITTMKLAQTLNTIYDKEMLWGKERVT
jgi:hypothetical protein